MPVPVSTHAPTGTTNAYVIGCEPAVLLDPGARADTLDRVVEEREVDHVLVTHHHPDHVGAVAHYAEVANATVWARRGRVDAFRQSTGCAPDRQFDPGTRIAPGDEAIRILDAPGHTVDHVAVRVGSSGPICCGDTAIRDGSLAVAAPHGDMRSYLSTLRRLLAIDPPRLLPGHGPVIDRPTSACERLLSHRLDRERRVIKAVEGGATFLEDIVDRSYEEDLGEFRELAKATTVAHLEKLAVEDRVNWDGNRAGPR